MILRICIVPCVLCCITWPLFDLIIINRFHSFFPTFIVSFILFRLSMCCCFRGGGRLSWLLSLSLLFETIQHTISTFAGGGINTANSVAATNAYFGVPYGVATDGNGNVYITDSSTSSSKVRKVSPTGIINTIAGTGTAGYSGDNGKGTSAQLNQPTGVAIDSSGNVYIADYGNHRIRVLNSAGILSTFAGTGTAGYSGDSYAATSAQLYNPAAVAVDSLFNVYIAEYNNHVIRMVNSAGIITTFAGKGTTGSSGDGGLAISAKLRYPTGVAVGVSLKGCYGAYLPNFPTCAGYTSCGYTCVGNYCAYSGTTCPCSCSLCAIFYPTMYLDVTTGTCVSSPSTSVYIADSKNNRIRAVSSSGIINTIAGTGLLGYSGDGGLATSALLKTTWALAVDVSGNVYIADSDNSVIRMVSNSGIITTYAGNGIAGFSGDGGAAISAQLYSPNGVAVDSGGKLYISDYYVAAVIRVVFYASPTLAPTPVPTTFPTLRPSMPTPIPSRLPTPTVPTAPTLYPTLSPTSCAPSSQPSGQPSSEPSIQPSKQPNSCPTNQPSIQPSRQPASLPSRQPTRYDTVHSYILASRNYHFDLLSCILYYRSFSSCIRVNG